MIADRIENIDLYTGLGDRIVKALKYISETDFSGIEKGKYTIDGDLIYAMVNEYETKPEADCKIEAHRKYIDLQFLISGEETMGYTPLTGQNPSIAYNEEKDCVFFEVPVSTMNFVPGMFAIFYPTDLHQPCIRTGETSAVKKVVVKIQV